MPVTEKEIIEALAQAIAFEEGFYAKGTKPNRPQRNNNPGNIRPWADCKFPSDSGPYIIFPTPGDGWRQLKIQCSKNAKDRGLTFLEFFAGKKGVYGGYAPGADNNRPTAYAQHVVNRVVASLKITEKVTINTKIMNLLSAKRQEEPAAPAAPITT